MTRSFFARIKLPFRRARPQIERSITKETEADIYQRVSQLMDRQRLSLFALIALLLTGAGIAVVPFIFPTQLETLSKLGTYFAGSSGLIWALAGTVLVFLAFNGQQHQIAQQQLELLLTRQELSLQRDALEAQRREMVVQNATLLRQQFENTFFELMRSHADVLDRIAATDATGDKMGAEAIGSLYAYVHGFYLNGTREGSLPSSVEGAVAAYDHVYLEYESVLGPYFRSLYQLIKYVDDQHNGLPTHDERRRFVNFVRARLASNELLFLFYNGLTDRGSGMRPLIERYAFLKHLPVERLIDENHLNEYSQRARGTRARPGLRRST